VTAVRLLGLVVLLGCLGAAPVCAFLSDTASHLPSSCGAYAYETFTPTSTFFPAVGGSYLDPIFGETITRLSNVYPDAAGNAGSVIIYSINGRWNADSTRYLHNNRATNQVAVIDTTTGAVIRANVPYPLTQTDEVSFDPVNADIYYYTSGTILKSYSLASGTSSNVKTFGGTLGTVGRSSDWIDRTGRYMLLNIANTFTMWDKTSDILFTGTLANASTLLGSQGWAGLSPDGNFIIIANGTNKTSYAVNTTTRVVTTTGVLFWDACFGDHGDVMTASDGNTYVLTGSCRYGENGMWRVSVTNAITAGSGTQYTMPGNRKFIDLNVPNSSSHNACATLPPNQDWCFMSVEDPLDLPGSPGTWYAYKSEIIMFQMVAPFEVRRLLHHRSRVNGNTYVASTPRVNPNWQGTALMFTSAMSTSVTSGLGYSDLYRWSVPW
jgi:hypothetical protein